MTSSRIVVGALFALFLSGLAFPPEISAVKLQEFLKTSEAYQTLPAVKHQPAFRVESFPPAAHAKGTEWYWIYDGNQKIGLIQTWSKELEMFRFTLAPGGTNVSYEIPRIHHWATLLGPRINLYAPLFLPVQTNKLTFTGKPGTTLELKTEEKIDANISGENTFKLSWDEKLGYIWTCSSHYKMTSPMAFEFNNLIGGGLSTSLDYKKRWQKVLRTTADGKLIFFYHNPLNCPVHDIAAGGFVGFTLENDINPFVELGKVNLPIHMATCSQWYDQHIIAKPATEKEADGLYHMRAEYRFLSLPKSVAGELDVSAKPANSGPSTAMGFLANQTNDFETPIPPDRVYNGPMWMVSLNVEYARSGKNSIKLSGNGKGKVVSLSPIAGGTAVYGESKKRYRLSAWVKTDLSGGSAYIEANDCFWNWGDIRVTRKSTKELTGKTDWTELSIEFQPGPDDPFILIKLCIDGAGTAWFDDLALMELH